MRTPSTIGQLARATGIPTSTVRYYERIGLLRPHGRTAGNYRVYSEEAVERVRFIRAAQATGFTLEAITALLDLRDGTTAVCQAVQVLLEERLSDVVKRMADGSLALDQAVEDLPKIRVVQVPLEQLGAWTQGTDGRRHGGVAGGTPGELHLAGGP